MDKNGFQFYPGRRLPVVCRDGVTRSAVATGFASLVVPAAVQVYAGGKRRTVSGFISLTGKRLNATPELLRQLGLPAVEMQFTATGANAGFIPWTAHKPRLAAAALRLIKATAYGRGAPGYIWDSPQDHSAALARGCILWFATSEWPQGGFAARAVLRRLPPDVLPQLCRFFDKLTMLYRLNDKTEKTPPPPPPVA